MDRVLSSSNRVTVSLFNSWFARICLLAGSLLSAFGAGSASAADDAMVFERSRALETEAMGLLLDHFNFEESLLAPDNDRLTVFVSVPHGARMVLEEVVLTVNGRPVVTHRYGIGELTRFLNEASQQIYMTRLPAGEHALRLDVRVLQGNVRQMKTHTFTKGKSAKYIDLQIAGDPVREVAVVEW